MRLRRRNGQRIRNPVNPKTDLRKNHLFKWNIQPNSSENLHTKTKYLRLRRRRKR